MNSSQQLSIKKYISTLESIKQSDEQSTLGSVLSLVRSSHEAVFIFNNNEFLGLISPFKTLYSSNYPYTTKVFSIVFKPPAITEETPVNVVAEHMLAAKIYVLPIFGKDGKLQSVIYGKNMLREAIKDASLIDFLSSKVELNTPIITSITSSVRDVFHALKEKDISRMIVVDAQGDLAGIVTRSDLMRSLIKPTSKMRFPKEGTHVGFYSLAGEKKFRKEEPIRKYYSAMVDSLPDDTSKKQIITYLITSPYNSIVLINRRNKPTGFLSMRDLLHVLTLLRPEEEVPIIIKKPTDSVNDKELEQVTEHLKRFGKKLRKRMEIMKIEVATEEPKSANGQTQEFNTTVIVTPVAGKALVAITKRRIFIDGIQEATRLIEKQHRRSGFSKEETKRTSLKYRA